MSLWMTPQQASSESYRRHVRTLVAILALVAAACTGPSGTQVSTSASSSSPAPSHSTPSQETDDSFAGGLHVRPDKSWAEPRSIAFYVGDRASLAVVHGIGGYYALDLEGVPECPANIREGEGVSVDGAHIVFTCADRSIWAEFDVYGKAVRGTQSEDRPAYRVVAHDDGSLVVFREQPPRPLPHYWPS